MKAIDLVLMLLTFNVLFVIINGVGCYGNIETISFAPVTLTFAAFITMMTGVLAASGVASSFMKPIGSGFAFAFTLFWSMNVSLMDSYVHFTDKFGWMFSLLVFVIGPIIGILGGLEFQTGVKV